MDIVRMDIVIELSHKRECASRIMHEISVAYNERIMLYRTVQDDM